MINELEFVLQKNTSQFHKVINFDPAKNKLHHFNFTSANKELSTEEIADTAKFSQYIDKKLKSHHADFGIGGYKENRVLYRRSNLFNTVATEGKLAPVVGEEETQNRSIHLGIDIWGPAGTTVFLPLGGMVHSFAYNANFGDYGATIIMQHQLDTIAFHTLYGHVSLADLSQLHAGKYLSRGEVIAHFGEPHENGNWPPHLHFQVIWDMNLKEGDYPGVCALAESDHYFANCPNPDLVLNMMQYAEE
ncbi:MAG: peptidoglycan DD-metalloendopeptidase family protein [Ferruginibacter sp.]